MVWYGMVWYGMVWYGMVWCGICHIGMTDTNGFHPDPGRKLSANLYDITLLCVE